MAQSRLAASLILKCSENLCGRLFSTSPTTLLNGLWKGDEARVKQAASSPVPNGWGPSPLCLPLNPSNKVQPLLGSTTEPVILLSSSKGLFTCSSRGAVFAARPRTAQQTSHVFAEIYFGFMASTGEVH